MGQVDQKRIARNTLLLYVRMALIMIVSLYTSRVVLDALGEVDYGLYGAVGGIVVAFSFLNGVMSAACNRYFAIEIGRNDHNALHKVFCLNVSIFLLLGAIILVLSETFGLWFLNAKMVFPPERATAVNWVFQLSVLSFIATMLSTPYRAIIIAKEKMKVFAYSSIVEAFLKLGIAFALVASCHDKLILYAALMCLVSIAVSLFYWIYCSHFYEECRYRFFWDRDQFREIVGYTGWNVVGTMSGIFKTQGSNILLNMFFGPVVNAAFKVAYQVYLTINQFVSNFCTAFNPQITKSYASGEDRSMMKLVFQSSKFSYYLLFMIVLPFCLEAEAVLDIWLKDVPAHSVIFTRLMLVAAVIDSISYPLVTAVQATGKIKWYQIFVGGTMLLTLPIAYLMFKFGNFAPESVFVVIILLSVVAQVLRVIFMKRLLKMSVADYLKEVLLPVGIVTVLSSLAPVALLLAPVSFYGKGITVIVLSILSIVLCVWFAGMKKSERAGAVGFIKSKWHHS